MGKTAVVIVHGVGEQHPMVTVRGFVRLFTGRLFRSKPDRDSSLFELRRLSSVASTDVREALDAVAAEKINPYPFDTVFYEYYWAFHYRDTELGLVIRWTLS